MRTNHALSTCSMIPSVDLARYGVSRAKDFGVSGKCGTICLNACCIAFDVVVSIHSFVAVVVVVGQVHTCMSVVPFLLPVPLLASLGDLSLVSSYLFLIIMVKRERERHR